MYMCYKTDYTYLIFRLPKRVVDLTPLVWENLGFENLSLQFDGSGMPSKWGLRCTCGGFEAKWANPDKVTAHLVKKKHRETYP